MSLNKHVDAGRFGNLHKILSAWIRLNRQYCISIRGDAPWWYNERASPECTTTCRVGLAHKKILAERWAACKGGKINRIALSELERRLARS